MTKLEVLAHDAHEVYRYLEMDYETDHVKATQMLDLGSVVKRLTDLVIEQQARIETLEKSQAAR